MPTITITDDQRLNLLTSALEGGSNYWYYLNIDFDSLAIKYNMQNATVVDIFWTVMKAGKGLTVRNAANRKEVLGDINLKKIEKGEQLMAEQFPHHFADIISEKDDAITADVWFQFAVMGELVYG